jgi:serine/threonine protein kinase
MLILFIYLFVFERCDEWYETEDIKLPVCEDSLDECSVFLICFVFYSFVDKVKEKFTKFMDKCVVLVERKQDKKKFIWKIVYRTKFFDDEIKIKSIINLINSPYIVKYYCLKFMNLTEWILEDLKIFYDFSYTEIDSEKDSEKDKIISDTSSSNKSIKNNEISHIGRLVKYYPPYPPYVCSVMEFIEPEDPKVPNFEKLSKKKISELLILRLCSYIYICKDLYFFYFFFLDFSYMYCLMCGVKSLHEAGIAHMDIANRNCLITYNYTTKLSLFLIFVCIYIFS